MNRLMNTLLLLLACMSFSIRADTPATVDAILHGQGLLWKIEKPGVEVSYVFGTMHVSDARVTQLPAAVERAFTVSDKFVMEMLPSPRAREIIAEASYFRDGRTLRHLMQSEDYLRLTRLMHHHLQLSEQMYLDMRPWAVLLLLSMPVQDLANDKVLDLMLYQRARERGIDMFGLETPRQQLAAMESLDLDEQVWLLNKSVSRYSRLENLFQSMIEKYVQRDLAALQRMQHENMHGDSTIDDRFIHALLDQRNVQMADQLLKLLPEGKLFVAIGALHLPGGTGVLHLLERSGYRVTPVY